MKIILKEKRKLVFYNIFLQASENATGKRVGTWKISWSEKNEIRVDFFCVDNLQKYAVHFLLGTGNPHLKSPSNMVLKLNSPNIISSSIVICKTFLPQAGIYSANIENFFLE